ncbi:hypothetical protein ACFQDG_07990 [Natronoarchaeum mannanilyticum]|uniref:Uncharacterized protein n=1 Tax=Natronoarchaeum mannanilyticum TaxID=926360 RepID=A0AAV3T8F0_9EURY
MDPDAQRTVAAWAVLLLGGVGCGVMFTLLEGADAGSVLRTYAFGIAIAVAAGTVPLPGSLDRLHPLGD